MRLSTQMYYKTAMYYHGTLWDCEGVYDNKQQLWMFSVEQSSCVVAGTTLKTGSSKWSFTADLCVLHPTSNSWGLGVGRICSVKAKTFQASHLHKTGLLQCPHSAQVQKWHNFKGAHWNGWIDTCCSQLGNWCFYLFSTAQSLHRIISKAHFERPVWKLPSPCPSSNWLKQSFVK